MANGLRSGRWLDEGSVERVTRFPANRATVRVELPLTDLSVVHSRIKLDAQTGQMRDESAEAEVNLPAGSVPVLARSLNRRG